MNPPPSPGGAAIFVSSSSSSSVFFFFFFKRHFLSTTAESTKGRGISTVAGRLLLLLIPLHGQERNGFSGRHLASHLFSSHGCSTSWNLTCNFLVEFWTALTLRDEVVLAFCPIDTLHVNVSSLDAVLLSLHVEGAGVFAYVDVVLVLFAPLPAGGNLRGERLGEHGRAVGGVTVFGSVFGTEVLIAALAFEFPDVDVGAESDSSGFLVFGSLFLALSPLFRHAQLHQLQIIFIGDAELGNGLDDLGGNSGYLGHKLLQKVGSLASKADEVFGRILHHRHFRILVNGHLQSAHLGLRFGKHLLVKRFRFFFRKLFADKFFSRRGQLCRFFLRVSDDFALAIGSRHDALDLFEEFLFCFLQLGKSGGSDLFSLLLRLLLRGAGDADALLHLDQDFAAGASVAA